MVPGCYRNGWYPKQRLLHVLQLQKKRVPKTTLHSFKLYGPQRLRPRSSVHDLGNKLSLLHDPYLHVFALRPRQSGLRNLDVYYWRCSTFSNVPALLPDKQEDILDSLYHTDDFRNNPICFRNHKYYWR